MIMKDTGFAVALLNWHRTHNTRQMPWKGEKDPYKVWLSEIILQQTRVDQGLEYYNRFVQQYPTITALASAPHEEVFKLWEGLGYYSRCRNLIHTARLIVDNFNGIFPSTYHDILLLKGVGRYTAAAISSFAFDLPYAVVDGNVQRILSRYFGINTPVDTTEGRRLYDQLAQSLLIEEFAAEHNQAIMDLGAMVCKPQLPICEECPLKANCEAYIHGMTRQLPVKEKKLARKQRWLNYFVIENPQGLFIRKRTDNDIWQNLHEFVLIESSAELEDPGQILESLIGEDFSIKRNNIGFRQLLTHQVIHGRFFHVYTDKEISIEGYQTVHRATISSMAFPRIINRFLESELA